MSYALQKLNKYSNVLDKESKLHKSEISVKIGSHKLRKLRDLIETKGGEVHKREAEKSGFPLGKLGVSHLVDQKGRIKSKDIHEHLQELPGQRYDHSFANYGTFSGGSDSWENWPEEAYFDARQQEEEREQESYSFYDYLSGSVDINDLHRENLIDDYKEYYKNSMGTADQDNIEQEFEDHPDQFLYDYIMDAGDDVNSKAHKFASEYRDGYWESVSESASNSMGSPSDYQDIIDNYTQEGPERTEHEYEYASEEQRHSSDLSKVFQLNLHYSQIGDLQRAGVWDTYKLMDKVSRQSAHPVGEHGIGWARYTDDNDDSGVHIDEIQSDFGQSLVRNVRKATQFLKENPEKAHQRVGHGMGDMTWKELVNSFPEEHVNKINEIIFGNHHPSHVIHEAFLQHLRDSGKHDVPVHIWGAKGKAPLSGQDVPESKGLNEQGDMVPTVLKHYTQLKPEHQEEIARHWKLLADNTENLYDKFSDIPELKPTEPGMGVNVNPGNWKHWLPLAEEHPHFHVDSKAKQPIKDGAGYYSTGKPLPVHMTETYHKIPKTMGYDPGEYGKIDTQHNPSLEGEGTWADKVRKTDSLYKSLASAQYLLNKAHNQLPGGLAAKKHPADFDAVKLWMGTQVEMEHTNNWSLAREIAMDHLVEDPQYYTKLILMERSNPLHKSEAKVPHVASVAVINGDQMLMGKRQDNGLFTTPGGHIESGESPKQGALRELKEEAGVEPEALHFLGSKKVKCEDDKYRVIHAFCAFGKHRTSSKNDPDEEVKRWQWVNCKKGLPENVMKNLHSPKNVTLKLLKLQK
jgi:ADP-ribose pyrophosphatase YjhB (NUDIX family)